MEWYSKLCNLRKKEFMEHVACSCALAHVLIVKFSLVAVGCFAARETPTKNPHPAQIIPGFSFSACIQHQFCDNSCFTGEVLKTATGQVCSNLSSQMNCDSTMSIFAVL